MPYGVQEGNCHGCDTRSRESYSPSRSSRNGYECDFGRSQSVTEGQRSVNESQIYKLYHPDADNTALPLNRADTATRSPSQYLKSHLEGLQQCLSAQKIQDPFRSVKKLH
ncbi:hypothetical protein O181_102948 [Austropuccinia psidii MF-1]|uniref:Uncharacterized protein n=1 Tax=Austropuccinia psidii MF-1 TaxID=1389203 RepID=A0A9Q3JJE5_9BASI|nr:hypothetical protein [Austropuccinia psidii MF-1]